MKEKIEDILERFTDEQFYMMSNDEEFDFVSFVFDQSNTTIVNPYMDETGRDYVDPEKYYGKENFEKWKNEATAIINKKINA